MRMGSRGCEYRQGSQTNISEVESIRFTPTEGEHRSRKVLSLCFFTLDKHSRLMLLLKLNQKISTEDMSEADDELLPGCNVIIQGFICHILIYSCCYMFLGLIVK